MGRRSRRDIDRKGERSRGETEENAFFRFFVFRYSFGSVFFAICSSVLVFGA